MKKGLVMEGGALRGLFTCGCLDVLMENGIEFDGAIGVSAGACFGCNIKSKQVGRAYRYNMKYVGTRDYASFHSLITTGDLFNVEFCYEKLPYELDLWDEKTYRDNPMDFHVVCTDVNTGKAVYHRCNKGDREDIRWIRASASMPLLARIVEIDGRQLLDGGVGDSIPLKYFQHLGYDKNVVILTQPKGYVKEKNKLMPAIRVALKKYPKMVRALGNRHLRYNKTVAMIEEKEAKGEIFVIRPPEALNIKSTEKDKAELQRVYDIGRETMESQLKGLRAYLGSPS